jgi:hypothetical protein
MFNDFDINCIASDDETKGHEKTEGAIHIEKSRNIDNAGHTRHRTKINKIKIKIKIKKMSYTDPTKITLLTCPFVSSSEAIQLISKSLNIHLQPPQRR